MCRVQPASGMKIKAIVPWFGSKRSMGPAIAIELGEHVQYFEPFCGSMAALFAKKQSRMETVNDLHGDLINLAGVVQDEFSGPWLYARLQRTLFSEDLLREAQEYFREQPADVDNCGDNRERAYWYFLASWMGRNGVAGMSRVEYQAAVRWTAGGGSPTIRWQSAVESLPAWHRRLSNVVILNRDAFKIIPKFQDSAETAIYIDPPYALESRSSGKYLHDFAAAAGDRGLFDENADDELPAKPHESLRDLLAEFKHARIVVSYYDCPEIRDLYQGWTFLDHGRQKNLHAQNGRGARKAHAPEVLIVNGPSFAKEATACSGRRLA